MKPTEAIGHDNAWVQWHLVESNAEEILGLMFEQGRF